MAARQMLKSMMDSATMKHLGRSHLFLNPLAGLKRNSLWRETMESDVLVYDFQDGCPPGERDNVMKGLGQAHEIYPNMKLSVRVTELERDVLTDKGTSTIFDEISASLKQKQVYWLMLPMCDDPQDVQEYIEMINSIDKNWLKNHGGLQLVCETPCGLHNLDDMLEAHQQVKGVIAGGGDYFRFAQGNNNSLLPHFRWEVLNACLRHGVFPIDTPPLALGIKDGIAKNNFQSGADAGFRAGVTLHPQQVQLANEIFSPSPSDVERCQEMVGPWLEKRETGYTRSSGDDFHGPPHLKQMYWMLKYEHQIQGKKTAHVQAVDPDLLPEIASLLSGAHPVIDTNSDTTSTNSRASEYLPYENLAEDQFLNTSMFLALSSSCHDRHGDLLANLGCTNVEVGVDDEGNPMSFKDTAFLSSQIIGRHHTSAGNVIVTTKVQIMDRNYKNLCTMERRLMEERLAFDVYVNEGMYPHADEANNRYARMTAEDLHSIIDDDAVLIGQVKAKTVCLDVHTEYCSILNLDAPLHHTVRDKPVVPSTLHLSHHDLEEILNKGFYCQNITFHAPMKPGEAYTASKYYVEVLGTATEEEQYIPALLSIICDKDGDILSSVLMKPRNDLEMIVRKDDEKHFVVQWKGTTSEERVISI